ncbi:hypothetical protein OKJ48_17930 [Streptomyces kunmingensis]|uniref:WXG100 family type VII secretion target n=1 Tax=Streptomyces kunmingensis TaxID=68225 RepID=A0ABU6CBN4_9ACTN|nr:hypothetical protein [Streptomyces kunmingensis]MEB3962114.1 hypothetical protein [Streptomyces kunmingensis]
MTLAVKSADLVGYAGLVRRAAGDCGTARAYLDRSTAIDSSLIGELWDGAVGDHEKRVREARDVLGRFDAILDASVGELKKTAAWYDSIDLTQARKLDATYPGVTPSHVPRPRPSGGTSFRDVSDAGSRLKPPGGADGWLQGHLAELEFAPANKVAGTLLDFGSVSALANEGLKFAFGYDILGNVTNWLMGDWQSYADCADAWDCLGGACSDMAANIRHGNSVLDVTWQGNAADAAWKYFDNSAGKLDATRDAFHDLRDRYLNVARLVFSFAETAKGAIAEICDWGIQVAVSAAASTAVAFSGVGIARSFVGAAFAAERVTAMVKRYRELTEQYDRLMAAVNLAFAAVGGMCALVGDMRKFPVVGKSYDNALL